MSRVRVFGLNNRSVGEFSARVSRGWAITGAPDVRGGGESFISIGESAPALAFMNFGRMALVEQAGLPTWAGVIDPAWNAYGAPAMNLYNIEYLLSLRTPDEPEMITGTTATIAGRMIDLINRQEQIYLRLGETDKDQSREEELDRRDFWTQLKALIERAGMEMTFRPQVTNGVLLIFVDIEKKAGKKTNFLYQDGQGGNLTVLSANVNERIWNRVIGINDSSSESERLQTDPLEDDVSIKLYRTRSTVVQFRGVTEISTLEAHTQEYLDRYSRPRLEMTAQILDKGDAFANADLGNTAIFHAANVRLPLGARGFRGEARMLALAYDEQSNTLGVTVVARL